MPITVNGQPFELWAFGHGVNRGGARSLAARLAKGRQSPSAVLEAHVMDADRHEAARVPVAPSEWGMAIIGGVL